MRSIERVTPESLCAILAGKPLPSGSLTIFLMLHLTCTVHQQGLEQCSGRLKWGGGPGRSDTIHETALHDILAEQGSRACNYGRGHRCAWFPHRFTIQISYHATAVGAVDFTDSHHVRFKTTIRSWPLAREPGQPVSSVFHVLGGANGQHIFGRPRRSHRLCERDDKCQTMIAQSWITLHVRAGGCGTLCRLILSHAYTCTHSRPDTQSNLPLGTLVSRRHEHEHVLMFSHKLVHSLGVLMVMVLHAGVPPGL